MKPFFVLPWNNSAGMFIGLVMFYKGCDLLYSVFVLWQDARFRLLNTPYGVIYIRVKQENRLKLSLSLNGKTSQRARKTALDVWSMLTTFLQEVLSPISGSDACGLTKLTCTPSRHQLNRVENRNVTEQCAIISEYSEEYISLKSAEIKNIRPRLEKHKKSALVPDS